MRTSTLILASLVLVIVGTTTVRAQSPCDTCPAPSDEWNKMWNIRFGAFIPNTTDDLKTVFNFGIEHEHPAGDIIRGLTGNFSLSADVAQFNSFDGVDTRKVTLVPFYLNWKKHYMIEDSTAGQSWYWGFGAGVWWSQEDIPEMSIFDRSQFAWNVSAGYNFGPAWFGEVRYLASKDPSDSRIWSLDLGYSF